MGRGGKEGARVSEPEASPCSGEQGQPPPLCKHTAATQTHAATPSQAQRHTEGQPCNHTHAHTHTETHSHKYKGTLRHINTRCPPEHAQGRCGHTHPSALVSSLRQVSEYCARPGPWGSQGRSSTTLLGLVALLANANWEDAQGSAAPQAEDGACPEEWGGLQPASPCRSRPGPWRGWWWSTGCPPPLQDDLRSGPSQHWGWGARTTADRLWTVRAV